MAFTPEPALPPAAAATDRRAPSRRRGPPAPRPWRWCSTLPPQDAGHSEFRINGVPFWKAKPFLAALGETQLWTVRNDTDWDHPFHLHGYFFMAVDEQGVPLAPHGLEGHAERAHEGAPRACS